jgi:hypothetical protein
VYNIHSIRFLLNERFEVLKVMAIKGNCLHGHDAIQCGKSLPLFWRNTTYITSHPRRSALY